MRGILSFVAVSVIFGIFGGVLHAQKLDKGWDHTENFGNLSQRKDIGRRTISIRHPQSQKEFLTQMNAQSVTRL